MLLWQPDHFLFLTTGNRHDAQILLIYTNQRMTIEYDKWVGTCWWGSSGGRSLPFREIFCTNPVNFSCPSQKSMDDNSNSITKGWKNWIIDFLPSIPSFLSVTLREETFAGEAFASSRIFGNIAKVYSRCDRQSVKKYEESVFRGSILIKSASGRNGRFRSSVEKFPKIRIR